MALLLAGAIVAGPAAAPVDALTTIRVSQEYRITATLDVASGRLAAVELLTLTNRAPFAIDHVNLSVIPRALGYFDWDREVTVDGEPVAAEWTTDTNLRVPLPERLRPDQTAEIRLAFRLDVGTSRPPFTARLSRENGVLSFGHWFPILSREHASHGVGDPQLSFTADLIRLELTTTTPLPRHAVACPGLLIAPATSGDRWVCEADRVRDFSFVVNPAFRLTTREVGDTTIRVYTQTVSGEVTANLAATALSRLNGAYGTYPWRDLVVAEVGSGTGFSMEYPRAIHATRTKVTDTYLIYHEMAHQWFYAQIGNDQMLEPWLDEGFADFTARWLMGIRRNQCSSLPVDSDVFTWEAGPISGGDWESCDGYFHTVFYKSTEFLNALRGRMGDEQFFAAIRAFVDEHRFGVVTGLDLLHHLQGWNEADLEPIYRAYLADYRPPPTRPPRLSLPERPDLDPRRSAVRSTAV